MPDSPLADSPFAVLGVTPDASETELRRAYRRRLREAHPDTGGSPAEFHAVQRAWELVGTAEERTAARRAAEARETAAAAEARSWAPRPAPRPDGRPRSRSYGHPGGQARERYLSLIREWAGRGVDLDDPYEPSLVRGAPIEIRRLLAQALAEEATARTLGELGIGYSVWHDVVAEPAKIDHLVLGPTGLVAIRSADFGGPVQLRRGEIEGEGVVGEPLHELAASGRRLARAVRVPLAAAILVVPDGQLGASSAEAGRWRGVPLLVAERPVLAHLLRGGAGAGALGGTDLFEARSRLQRAVRHV